MGVFGLGEDLVFTARELDGEADLLLGIRGQLGGLVLCERDDLCWLFILCTIVPDEMVR